MCYFPRKRGKADPPGLPMALKQSIDHARPDNFAAVLARTGEALAWLRARHADGTLPLLHLPEKRDDIATILGYASAAP